MAKSDINSFWEWFARNEAELNALDPDAVVERVQDEIQRIDDGVGVEVGARGQPKELVVTAYGQQELFPLVRQIVEGAPALAWTVRALKPPGGFDFQFRRGSLALDVSALPFEPLESDADPALFGVQVFVPTGQVPEEEWPDIVSLILASGLGEERFAAIDHVAYDDLANAPENPLRLGELEQFIEWRNGKRR